MMVAAPMATIVPLWLMPSGSLEGEFGEKIGLLASVNGGFNHWLNSWCCFNEYCTMFNCQIINV